MGPDRGNEQHAAALSVRAATVADAAAVLAINAASRAGVARLDRRELTRLCEAGARILIATLAQPAGYLIAFAADAPYDGEEFRYLRGALSGSFVYVDQVAVAPHLRRHGIASALYRKLGSLSAAGTRLCCEVNLEPPNPGSLRFHRRLGFELLTELAVTDGRKVALLE
jgi:uncharacterized protein